MASASVETTAVLTATDVADVIRVVGIDQFMDDVIDGVRCAAEDLNPETTMTIERAGFQYEKPCLGLVEWMPSMELGRAVGIKTVGYHPSNPNQRGLPSVMATTSIHDTGTGRLIALVDATLLTAIRTGAASAVVTDILARPDSSTLALIGCGAQSVTQAHAISRVRPITRVLAFDADPLVAESLADRLPFAVQVEVMNSADEAASQADIICTATTVDIGAGPVISEAALLRPGVHINAVGADFPGKTELPMSVLKSALVVPDEVSQCLKEGESQQLAPSDLGPDLPALVQAAADHADHRNGLTIFDSTGWSLEDLIAAEIVLEHALHHEIGIHTELQHTPADPYNPYELL